MIAVGTYTAHLPSWFTAAFLLLCAFMIGFDAMLATKDQP